MAIICWQTEQNHFELFSCRKVSNILHMQNLQNIFWFDKKLQIFHPFYEVCMVLRSDFKFCFITSTFFSAFFAMDVETTQAKRILPFYFHLMNGTIISFVLFLLIFFWRWKTYQLCTLRSSSFLKNKKKKKYEYVNIS